MASSRPRPARSTSRGGISGFGTASINFGGTLEFDGTGITQNVMFANVGAGKATLRFNATATTVPNLIHEGVISGFSSPSDQIDLTGLSFSGNTSLTKTLVAGNTVIELTESGNVVDLTTAAPSRLGGLEYSHPVFELFRAPRSGDFSTARIYGYRAPLKPAGQVLARFED